MDSAQTEIRRPNPAKIEPTIVMLLQPNLFVNPDATGPGLENIRSNRINKKVYYNKYCLLELQKNGKTVFLQGKDDLSLTDQLQKSFLSLWMEPKQSMLFQMKSIAEAQSKRFQKYKSLHQRSSES